jgi:AraC-like DNA-binding protein/DNA gyrase inhibitor GyrI
LTILHGTSYSVTALVKKPSEPTDRFSQLLIEIQAGLDENIDLRSLAGRFGASAFHFHRTFARTIGETPKKHVERLRLERAAMMIAVTDRPIVDIALEVGFKNHETLTRNFRKFAGYTPQGYRRMAKRLQAERVANTNFHASDEYRLSRARFERLAAGSLLAIRHVGQYGALHETFGGEPNPWSELFDWACTKRVAVTPLRIGIYYDDPTLTPAALQRADICIPVRRSTDGDDRVRCIPFAGGTYCIVEYIGHPRLLLNAFRGCADEIRRSQSYVFRDGPPIEIVRETNVAGVAGALRLDACFPVMKRA